MPKPDGRRATQVAALLTAGLAVGACDVMPRGESNAAPVQRRAMSLPANESGHEEAQRIRAQRARAEQSGVVVFSAGSRRSSGAVSILVRPITGASAAHWVSVDTNCKPNCLTRRVRVASKSTAVKNGLSIATLAPGRWQMTAVRFGRHERRFTRALPFDVKRGYATYLGAFFPNVRRGGNKPLQLWRYSAIQQDFAHALSVYDETRGRRIINSAASLRRPTPVK